VVNFISGFENVCHITYLPACCQLQVITLTRGSFIDVEAVSNYIDPGYSASDSFEGDITGRVVVSRLVRFQMQS